MDAELLCLDLLIYFPLHASYNQLLHGFLFYRRSTALGRYCVKRLTPRCTVVIIEHGEIILNKKGELVEEDTTSMISLQYLHVYLFILVQLVRCAFILCWYNFYIKAILVQRNCSVDP